MGYIDLFNKQGIRLSVRHGNILWFDPVELVSDDLLSVAQEHKDELIAEIRASAGDTITNKSEVVPAYRFLWVATNLESFEEYDPRYGYEIGRDPVYRMLDAPFYAWLRHQMENASKAHNDGRLPDDQFAILRDRFNAIHTWAVGHIGEDALRKAMRTVNLKRYVPPCDATVEGYHQIWAEARRANLVRRQKMLEANNTDPRVNRLQHLLSTQGYAVIKTSVVDDVIIFVRDDGVALPTKWATKIRFTLDELTLMIGTPVETVKQICDIKQIFGGKVVGNEDDLPVTAIKDVRKEYHTAVQGSMF